jgi:hypothetical protein
MADDSIQILSMPPFPPLRWRDPGWAGRIVLGSWADFQSRLGAYAGRSPGTAPAGTVRLRIAAPSADPPTPPTPGQVAAYAYLLANEDAIRDALVAAIFEEYPKIRQKVLRDGTADPTAIPELSSPGDLKDLVGLAVIHVLRVEKDGAAYAGFEFGCDWDEEHGLGVMMHRGRIVEFPENSVGKVNGGDLASEDWLAEEDANAVG